MNLHEIQQHPAKNAAISLLEAASLPASDLTDAHMEQFFYCGSSAEPTGLIGLEIQGTSALLRSLAVVPNCRSSGIGAALVGHAEAHARALGVRDIFLLTTTAEAFFKRLGYVSAVREHAPAEIRKTREFAEICPASSAFLSKKL